MLKHLRAFQLALEEGPPDFGGIPLCCSRIHCTRSPGVHARGRQAAQGTPVGALVYYRRTTRACTAGGISATGARSWPRRRPRMRAAGWCATCGTSSAPRPRPPATGLLGRSGVAWRTASEASATMLVDTYTGEPKAQPDHMHMSQHVHVHMLHAHVHVHVHVVVVHVTSMWYVYVCVFVW